MYTKTRRIIQISLLEHPMERSSSIQLGGIHIIDYNNDTIVHAYTMIATSMSNHNYLDTN